MAIVINGIVCEEIVAGFEENFDLRDGPRPRKGFFVHNWADRYQVCVGLLGLATTTSIGGAITFQTPMQYPEISTCYASTIEIQPVGRPTQGVYQLKFPSCIVWVNYAVVPWSFNAFDSAFNGLGPFIFAEQKLRSSAEWVTVPGRGLKFSNGDPLNQDYGFRIGLLDIEINLFRLPYIPMATATASAGKINNASYLGASTGKLLFNGATTERTATTDGTFTQNCSYSFTWRSQRWDYALNPITGTWLQVQTRAGSVPTIESTDLSVIIPTAYQY